jgi:two-component system cell cycle sensor histidine kinase/response regulator CckA
MAAARSVFRSRGRGALRRRLNRGRERELAELLRESERLRADLERKLERCGRLSGAIAHDVNNLLSVVTLVASGLRDHVPPRMREQTEELCDSAIRAARLNRQLLALGRRATVGATDVNLVIEGMRRLLERLAGASLELVIDLDARPCLVQADPSQLERVLLNLVTNARDAMSGEGRLTIQTTHSAPSAVGDTGGDPRCGSVIVCVADTGSGMDMTTQRQIFEPFFTTKGGSGTGLGLAAVRDIVAGCGGLVRLESRPGGGTRFEVVLPVTPACEILPASTPSTA